MTNNRQLSITDDLYNYILDISVRESNVLKELRLAIGKEGIKLQSSPEQVAFIAFLIKLLNAKNIIEIGIYKGYSTLAFAQTLSEKGKIIACEINQEWADFAKGYWEKAGVTDKIDLRIALAEHSLRSLIAEGRRDSFDLIFIDADKENYDLYYELALLLIKPYGLIIIDNVLWYGNVIKPEINDKATRAIRFFNEKIKQDNRIDINLLPIRDGLMLVRKREI